MFIRRIILCSLLILSLCACNGNIHSSILENDLASSSLSKEENEDLENMVNNTMLALKNLDLDKFNAYTNNKQIMVTPWGNENIEYTLFGELCEEQQTDSDTNIVYQLDKEIIKNLTWEILNITQDNDTAKLELRITNLNMEGILQRAETESEMIAEIRKIPLNDTKTADLILKAEKQNEKWILLVDIDFANAISANIWIIDNTAYSNENLPYESMESDCFLPKSARNSITENLYTYEGVAETSSKQKIEIISAVDHSIITQITDLHEITDFLNQEEMYNWITVESIPDNSKHLLSIVRYALERRTINPQLKEQSQDLLYQSDGIYYIKDNTTYPFTETTDYEIPRYYQIPNNVGEYLKQLIQ